MMPIATTSLVTADPSSCSLAAADDHAWPQWASTASRDPLSRPRAPVHTLVSAIICPFGLFATAATAATGVRRTVAPS
jgi:hypothetical protein